MATGKSYVSSPIWRAVIGVTLAAALLAGAWFISNGGNAASSGASIGASSGATLARAAQQSPTGALLVSVSGVRSDHGFIVGALCREGELFVSGCSLKARSKAVQGVVALDFAGLAAGDYALALYHDENSNAALELGTEGIGFSNNANLAHAVPDFDASRIKVDGSTPIRVRLRYSIQ